MASRAVAMAAPAATVPLMHTTGKFPACEGAFAYRRIRTSALPQLQLNPSRRTVVVSAGRRSSGSPRRRKQAMEEDEDAAAEKALEALFAQLEKDLNSQDGEDDDDDDGVEFTDEDLEQMTKELEAVFGGIDLDEEEEAADEEEEEAEDEAGVVDMVMTDGVYSEASGAAKRKLQRVRNQEYDDDEDEEEEGDEQRMVPLEKWQIRKLAAAAEKGRRNVNVKALAAEVGMDRSDVLSFLKDPPPELLLMAAQWESVDEAAAAASPEVEYDFKVNVVDKVPRAAAARKPPPTSSGGPQGPRSWHGSKRLKKEHVATFERVYRQSSRPSNSMIENLVNLTHVPRKKVLQWFDDKRSQNQPRKQSFEETPEN